MKAAGIFLIVISIPIGFFGPEEFQWILKLGVWFKTEIRGEKPEALALANGFLLHEKSRDCRRKKKAKNV